MLALLSVWLGLAALVMSMVMIVWRPTFNDVMVTVDLYAAIFSLTFAGLVLWATRKDKPAFSAPRRQAKVGIILAILAVSVVYVLVHFATRHLNAFLDLVGSAHPTFSSLASAS